MVLVEEAVKGLGSEFMIAIGGFFFSGDETAKGGFSCSIGSDDGDFFLPFDFEVKAFEDFEFAIKFTSILEFGY